MRLKTSRQRDCSGSSVIAQKKMSVAGFEHGEGGAFTGVQSQFIGLI